MIILAEVQVFVQLGPWLENNIRFLALLQYLNELLLLRLVRDLDSANDLFALSLETPGLVLERPDLRPDVVGRDHGAVVVVF